MEIRMVDTITQYEHIKDEVDAEVHKVVTSGQYINGPWVHSFRKNLGEFLDAKHVVACGNGTDALQVALMALDLKPGDEVITSPFTFFATAEVVALLGLVPVFVDVTDDSFNIATAKIEAAITDRTRVIMPVHLFGQPADMQPIMDIAAKHNLFVVEDAAQSIGADYTMADGKTYQSGMVGHIGCTSFYPSKNLGAYGDGGALFTNDDELGHKMQQICNHGSSRRYFHDRIGVNSRLDSVQAAILDIKLKRLNTYNAARRKAADMYDAAFAGVDGLITPWRSSNCSHVFHQYTLRIKAGREERDRIQKAMMDRKIPAMIYYPVSLHLQEAYAPYGYKAGDFPVSERLSEEVISLPMHSELTAEQVEYIASNFLECYHNHQ